MGAEPGEALTPPRERRRWLSALGVVCAFVLLTVWLLFPLSTSPGTTLYQASTFGGWFLNQPDVTLNAWILAWDTHALSTGKLSSFFEANIFYPAPAALSFSDHMLGIVPLFAPLYLATQNLALALNLWVMSTFVFSGLAMYWVSLRWLRTHMAAGVAGIAYAFAPWRLLELSHVQLLSVQYLPLLVYAILRSARARDLGGWLSIFGLAMILSLSSYYLGYMGFTLAAIVMGVSLLLEREARMKRSLFVGSSLASAAFLMIPFSLPYIELAQEGAFVGKVGPSMGGMVAIGYLYPRNPTDPSFQSWLAWTLVPLLAVLGASVGTFTRRYRVVTLSVLVAGLVAYWLTLGSSISICGIQVPSIEKVASGLIPGWSALRVMNRFGIIIWFALSVLAALPFAEDVRWLRSFRISRLIVGLSLIAGLLVSIASLDLRTQPSPEDSSDLTPYRWLDEHGGGDPLLEWPMNHALINSKYMYLSTLHWLPLVNGYSGYSPPWAEMMKSLANGLPEPEAVKSLIELNVARWLLVHLDAAGRRDWRRLEEAGASLRMDGRGFSLYELPYREDEPPMLGYQEDLGVSIFGASRTSLTMNDLQAAVVPVRKFFVDRLFLGLPVALQVRNLGTATWPGVAETRRGLVGVVFRIRPLGESDYRPLKGFNRLPTDLAPGQAATVWSIVMSPRRPGSYELLPCLTQAEFDRIRCFEESTLTLRVGGSP